MECVDNLWGDFAVVVILDFYCQSAHDNPLVGPKYYSRPLYNTLFLLLFLRGLLLELLLIPPSPILFSFLSCFAAQSTFITALVGSSKSVWSL